MKEFYLPYNPNFTSLNLIDWANKIIGEYQEQGYVLTLRQLYYQFVARDIIENTERSYKNLGNIITKARTAGLISWAAIEDRNRGVKTHYVNESTSHAIESLPNMVSYDYWKNQDAYIEVWVEKEALGNVVARACEPLRVNYMSCKGYLSASEAYRAGKRFERKIEEGKHCVLIHLGDHDPSGLDMTRDNRERVDLFSRYPSEVTVNRVALNMNQVEKYAPPPNPAKLTDSRVKEYIKHYGRTSWELDALEPSVLEKLIINNVRPYINEQEWDDTHDREDESKFLLEKLGENWASVKNALENGDYDD